MDIKPTVSIDALFQVTPGAQTSSGRVSLGNNSVPISVPADADQLLVLKGSLDSMSVVAPSGFSLDLSAGVIDSVTYPPAPFDRVPWDDSIGATGRNFDGNVASFSKIYGIIVVASKNVILGNTAVNGQAWVTGPLLGGDKVSTQNLILNSLGGWFVAAGDELSISLAAGEVSSDFEIFVVGKA